jgi:flagellar basal body-associated protein FliL
MTRSEEQHKQKFNQSIIIIIIIIIVIFFFQESNRPGVSTTSKFSIKESTTSASS